MRALSGSLRLPLESAERGHLLETLVLGELRAWNHIHDWGSKISTWRTPDQVEVDFIMSLGRKNLGIEVKAAEKWKSDFSKTLKNLLKSKAIQCEIAVYLGSRRIQDGEVLVLPLKEFQKMLADDEIF